MTKYLSKTRFAKGLQCPRLLWLSVYMPEKLARPDTSAVRRMKEGTDVGELARDLFPGGLLVKFDRSDYAGMARRTAELLEKEAPDIYEATFLHDERLVMVDILHRNDAREWELYEVKNGTKLKDEHIFDAAYQRHVLGECGVDLKKVAVITLNGGYERGETLELGRLFKTHVITEETEGLQEEMARLAEESAEVLRGEEPDTTIGPRCDATYPCGAKAYCWPPKGEAPILYMKGIGAEKRFDLYEEGVVAPERIVDLTVLSKKEKELVRLLKSGRPYADRGPIGDFLRKLSFPIYHLDFETIQYAVPPWPGTRPYGQIPFQFSVHVQKADGSLEHAEFLGDGESDPRRPLAEALCRTVPADATVLAYNAAFEKGVLKTLAAFVPECEEHLLAIRDNLVDLAEPFRKRHCWTPAIGGGYSIKDVLPALVPEMAEAYKRLEAVHDGDEAMAAYAAQAKADDEEKARLRQSLLDYCRLDTLAMVKILNVLEALTKGDET